MDTATIERTARTAPSNLRSCGHCGRPYDWRRSASSWLRMTFCSGLCEAAENGITVDRLLRELDGALTRQGRRQARRQAR